MFAKNSYLVMAGMFLLLSIYFYQDSLISAVVLIWFSAIFFVFWLLHFLKVNYAKDYAPLLVRNSLLKYCLFGTILFPFHLVKYLSILMQSLSEEPVSQITEKIFIGQQLLWFHKKVFEDRKIGAVLDITIENREPFFIAMDKSIQYLKIPVLDKTSPSVEQLDAGVGWGLEQISQGRNLYVHCGAGHERSATFVAALLLKLKYSKAIDEAMSLIRKNRPKARFVANQQIILEKWLKG